MTEFSKSSSCLGTLFLPGALPAIAFEHAVNISAAGIKHLADELESSAANTFAVFVCRVVRGLI
jgi:hypothetical protein